MVFKGYSSLLICVEKILFRLKRTGLNIVSSQDVILVTTSHYSLMGSEARTSVPTLLQSINILSSQGNISETNTAEVKSEGQIAPKRQ